MLRCISLAVILGLCAALPVNEREKRQAVTYPKYFARIETVEGCEGAPVTNAGFGYPYDPNTVIYTIIRVPEGNTISLEFVTMYVESSPNCNQDSLKVLDGPTLLDTLCIDDNTGLPTYTSSTNKMTLIFRTDGDTGDMGWRADWTANNVNSSAAEVCTGATYVPSGDGCDGISDLPEASSGTVTSVNHPSNYPDNLDCLYKVSVAGSGTAMTLTWGSTFDIERARNCIYDWVRVFDAENNISYGPYCNGGNSPQGSISINADYAYILFHSDPFVNGRGFSVSYTSGSSTGGGTDPVCPNGTKPNGDCKKGPN